MPAIEVDDLHKSYGAHVALRGISFSVDEGEVVGFLGPNGAGKSTAMKIITGFLSPSSGGARVMGHDTLGAPIAARSHIGYLPENAPIYPDMRVRDYLDYVGRVRGMGTAERTRGIDRVADQCGIPDRLGQRVGALSKGYRQRVGLAQAMLHEPPILILDEPTTGLDPNQIVEIRNLIREIGRKRTVILSTHILSEVQATCDRVVIINQGHLVADGATDAVTARTRGGQLLQVLFAAGSVDPGADAVRRAVEAVEHVTSVRVLTSTAPDHYAFEVLADGDVRAALFRVAVVQGLDLLELAPERTNLEEVFRRLTVGASP
ncbi:MAG: ATP-binding cassette domain-containing protein [Myxococcota bacterium]|nr:ATP-binding cassette domain-containing protein [Myxococcota bacterium]MEC8424222.1 ATP-binding cassette domain-containing protein [Myxococcota bacterium]